jgi:phospholipid/cholesterol/gamma-HCH transport system substrate-binding protein
MTTGPRREHRQADDARRGVVALMALALVLGLVWLRASGRYDGPARLSAQLADAGGSLAGGADVKMRGVLVGKVSRISRGPDGGVRVGITMPRDRLASVPGNVVARILPATVFGTSFVDLVARGPSSGEPLRPGAVIPADWRQGTLELQQALDDIDGLVKALGPAELSSALGSAAQALDGRGARIGSLIERLDDYLGKVDQKMPVLRSDLRKLHQNLLLANDVAPDLLAATRDVLVTARTVVDQQAALARLLTGATALSDRAADFLAANQALVVRFLDNADVLLDAVHDNRHAAVTEALATNRMLQRKLDSILEHGFADTLVKIELDPPAPYTAADCPRFGAAHGDNCAAPGRAAAPWMFRDAR